jgi:predicted ATPase
MSQIKIKNFGPIKEGILENDGWIDIKKVTIFIGNQGTGKSTIAKLISTFTWIEKALTRGDYDERWFTRKNKLRNQYLPYHRIENYLSKFDGLNATEIEYRGDSYHIKYENGALIINKATSKPYPLPQIMYVPAERNFIANVRTPKALKLTSDSLVEFVTEYDNAKNEMRGAMNLPINGTSIEYDKLNDVVNIKGVDYKIKLTEASSGYQSSIPLYLVSWFLANTVKRQTENTKDPISSEELERFRKGVADIWSNNNMSDEQKRIAISVLSSKFNKTAFINIVEELEQNLYPTSQRRMLNSLLEFNNMSEGNKLIITTHSPYIVNYLALAIKAYLVYEKIQSSNSSNELNSKISEIVPFESKVAPTDWAIYELTENGRVLQLVSYDKLPSDENFLNQKMGESNELFAKLLEIEDKCR